MEFAHNQQEDQSSALERVTEATYDSVRCEIDDNDTGIGEARQRLAHAASDAINRGATIGTIAQYERRGVERATQEFAPGLYKAVVKASDRRREATDAYETAIRRAARLLSYREIGDAAGVSHATIRTIATRERSEPAEDNNAGAEDHAEDPAG
jgi:hypothetical protein